MSDREPTAAGAIIALTTIAGAIVGAAAHQVTLGLLGGVAAGTGVAIALWLAERRRIGR